MDYKVGGMMCPMCKKRVMQALATVPGVKSVEVDLDRGVVKIEGNPNPLDLATALSAQGYTLISEC